MYAVIESGGKQYRVEVGTELQVELLDVEPGQALTLDRVLLIGDEDETAIGRPLVANASVEAEVLRRDRGPKLIVFKYRPKARRRVKKGHRQEHTILRITDVRLGSKSAAASVRKAEQVAKSERQRLEEAAARQAAADAALAATLAKSKPAETSKTARPSAKLAPKSPSKTTTKDTAASPAKATKSTKSTKTTTKTTTKPTTKTTSKPKATTAKAKPTSKAPATKPARKTKAAPKRGRTK
ncbi:MAG: 50S ribosomal protein L21 [Chloroflexota bacterium]